jgi:hypothetical protein
MVMNRIGLLMLLWGLAGVGHTGSWREMREEAGKGLPPRIQYYNRLKGEPKLVSFFPSLDEPESLNVRLVGKWGRGPAATITGRDSLVYLGLGSEVAIFNVNTPHNPRIVNEVQCRYVVDRVILKDTLLYCVLQGGVEVFNIANPQSVNRIKYFPLTVVDMCIQDTLAYTISADSFKVYRIVSPDSLLRLGACADSGYYIAADSGFAYLCDRWGLYVIDATDPANPHQATILTGAQTGAVLVDSGYCYYTQLGSSTAFVVADVSDPYAPFERGRRPNTPGGDIHKLGFYAYLSGFQIMDVAGHGSPTQICSLSVGGIGVWTRSPYSYSFVAIAGLMTINISDPVNPQIDTVVARADLSYDVSASSALACVANYRAGMKLLDVGNPSAPTQIGEYDTTAPSAVVLAGTSRNTFGYVLTEMWVPANLRVLDVSSPANPSYLGGCYTWNPGEAIQVRESLAYVAEDNHFEVFSIANPRAPRLVGSCGLPNSSYGLCLRDTLAFVGNLTSLQIVNVANPATPTVIGVRGMRALGVAVKDTLALVGGDGKFYSVSVANPRSPYIIDSLVQPGAYYGLAIAGNTAFAGGGRMLRVVDISSPDSMRSIGYHFAPDYVLRVCLRDSLVFAACEAGGVCIFETTSTGGIAEDRQFAGRNNRLLVTPNPVRNAAAVRLEGWSPGSTGTVSVFDATGRLLKSFAVRSQTARLDLTDMHPGVLFVSWTQGNERVRGKLIKE